MDRLAELEAFIAVAEARSFARAAAHLRVSPASVTTRIAQLEARLGVRLLNRTTRRVDLTEQGRGYMVHARAVLDAFAAAESSVKPSGRGIVGRVRIDAPASVGRAFIVPALARFRRAYPEISVELSLGDRGTVFRADGFDILLRVGHAPVSNAVVERLGDTRLLCFAAPAYLAEHGVPVTPADLHGHRCIVYSSTDASGDNCWQFLDRGKPCMVRPPASLIFNDGTAITEAALAGLGIARNLEMLVRPYVDGGQLVPVLEGLTPAALPVVLTSSIDRHALPYVAAAFAFMTREIDWGLSEPAAG